MLPYYRITSDEQAGLLAEIEPWTIYDCHEHLSTEKRWNETYVDAFKLFSHYCRHDLLSAGMQEGIRNRVINDPEDLDWKWAQFKPYYLKCKDLAYFRAAHITMAHFYGAEELTDDNYKAVSARVRAANKPGLFRTVLRDNCNIAAALSCGGLGDSTEGGLVLRSTHAREVTRREQVLRLAGETGGMPVTLELLETRVRESVRAVKEAGGFGIKFMPTYYRHVPRKEAEDVLQTLLADEVLRMGENNALNIYLADAQMRACGEEDLVCMIHTGYWRDFRELSPENLIPLIGKNPDTKFDVYHVGYPYVREAIMLGKNYGNVRMNMAWTYIISQKFAFEALDEMLEVLPDNKVFAFGGDYFVPEKIFGHLVMARETIAAVLAKKIREHALSTSRAVDLAHKMFYDNPKAFYALGDN